MFQFLMSILGSAYMEVVIFFVLIGYFLTHRQDPRMVASGINFLRVLFLLIIFLYFIWSWATLIPPSLRAASVIGMFLINCYMFYNLILSRMERPYRNALVAIGENPEKHEILHDIWHYGKRFYSAFYIFQSLFSGTNPVRFLHNMATERVRSDIKDELHRYGVEKKLITLQEMAGYLKSQLACDATLPVDFKEVMDKAIGDFAKHPWIEENANEFLQIVTERPEDLHFPEWMSRFEACVREYKK
jgi:hypothetical protein